MLASLPALGAEPDRVYMFYFENDVDALSRKGDDRFYTNGVRLAVGWEDCYVPKLLRGGDRGKLGFRLQLPFTGGDGERLCKAREGEGEADSGEFRFNVGAHIAQNMYTPEDILNPLPQPRDRPYGAWLYLGLGLNLVSEAQAHALEIDLGMVGPSAQGEAVQDFIHLNVTDSPEAQGWDHQIQDEPALLLLYTGRWRLAELNYRERKVFDLIPSWGGALGNVFTYGKVGAMGRLGWNLPNDFGPPGILPALASPGSERPPRWDAYLFASAEGRAVAHNIFLDGSTFRDGPSVDREDFVTDLEIGFSVRWRAYRLTYRQVRRSPEFTLQVEKQTFGAVNLTWNLPVS
jgi:hypothetical protein